MESLSFTQVNNTLVNQLITQCGVSESFDPKLTKKYPKTEIFNALWDTGATNSVITKKVAEKLGLIPTGVSIVHGVSGQIQVETYSVNISLPNNVMILSLRVTEGILGDFDVLIGMDVISKGDFVINNSNNQTIFSFQIPATHQIDFVKESNKTHHTPIKLTKKPGRNDPCHCGSGKKYKNCHEKIDREGK
jgi:hypothetical protein